MPRAGTAATDVRTVRLAIEGSADSWRPVLEARALELADRPTRLVLDVERSGELDGRALGTIVLATKLLERGGGELELVGDRPDLRRLLQATGLERAIEVVPSGSGAPRDGRDAVGADGRHAARAGVGNGRTGDGGPRDGRPGDCETCDGRQTRDGGPRDGRPRNGRPRDGGTGDGWSGDGRTDGRRGSRAFVGARDGRRRPNA